MIDYVRLTQGLPDFVRLTQADRDQARQWSNEVLASIAGRINHITGTTEGLTDDRYYFGYLGEIATDHWLTEKQIDHTYRVNTSGESQKSEFLVPCIGRLEVKTASEPTHQYFLLAKDGKTDFEVAIGVRLAPVDTDGLHDGADIMGWIGIKDVPKLEIAQVRILNRRMYLKNMRKLPRLIEICLARQGTFVDHAVRTNKMTLKQSRCRSCRAPIVWMKTTPKRKNISVDPDGIDEADLEWDGDHPLFDPKKGHITHFATCPNADSHRKS